MARFSKNKKGPGVMNDMEAPDVSPEPKKKGGFSIGGIFSGKKKKNIEVDEEVVDYYEEDEVPVVAPQSRRQIVDRTRPGGGVEPVPAQPVPGRTIVSRGPVGAEGQVAPAGRVVPQRVGAPEVQPAPRPVMSNAMAKENYGEARMDNTVMLYINRRYFATVQQAFNLREGVACAGVSDPKMLLSMYRSKPIFNFIVMFVMEQSEVEHIVNFLVSLNLSALNPELLKILIVRDVDVNVNAIKENPQLKTVARLSEFVRLIKNTGSSEGLTDAFVDKVIAEVVAKQPAFPTAKKSVKPQNATVYINTQGSFKVDITKLNENLVKARSEEGANAAIVAQVKQRLVGSPNSGDLTKLLGEVGGDIPGVQIIKEIEKEVSAQMNRLKDNPRAKTEIAELIKTKLLLSTLETREFQTVIDKILTNAQISMKEKFDNLSTMSAQDMEQMQNMKAGTDELVKARNQMRAKVDKEFEDYYVMAKLVVAAIKLEETQLAELNGTLLRLNTTVGSASDETTLSQLHSTLVAVKQLETEVTARGEQTKKQMAKAYAYANALLRDTKQLLSVDDSLINELQAQIETLSRRQTVILTTDSRLKERAGLIYAFPGGGFASMFGLISESTDLFVNVEAIDGSFAEAELIEAKNRRVVSAEELKSLDPDVLMRGGERLEIRVRRDEPEADRVLSIIDYMSSFYSNVYIAIKVVDTVQKEEFSEAVELFKKNVAKVIFWTEPTDEVMFLVNKYNTESLSYLNVVLRKVVFNKFILKKHGDKVDTFCVTANLDGRTFRIRVPFLADLANNAVPPKEYINKLKEIKVNM